MLSATAVASSTLFCWAILIVWFEPELLYICKISPAAKIFWLIVIHAIELAALGVFFLIRRNNALEKAVIQQREFMDAISIIVANSDAKLKELDIQGAFEADDEVGTFFKNLVVLKTQQDTLIILQL